METILSGNGASEYGPRGTRSVPRGAPTGRPEGAELLHKGAKCDFALCPVGAPQGDVLVHSDWENVNMPSVLANTSTEHSQEDTLLFSEKENQDFAGPLGDTPIGKVTLRKSCLAPADYGRKNETRSYVIWSSSIMISLPILFKAQGPLAEHQWIPPFDHSLRSDEWTARLHNRHVFGYVGVYVDDLLIAGP